MTVFLGRIRSRELSKYSEYSVICVIDLWRKKDTRLIVCGFSVSRRLGQVDSHGRLELAYLKITGTKELRRHDGCR